MTQTRRTPGPWHIRMMPGPIIYGTKGEQIADMRQHWLLDDEHIANLRLIAAAPDLLAALQGVVEWAGRWRPPLGPDTQQMLAAVNVAIAKAEGRS